jgi:hypothetical protein
MKNNDIYEDIAFLNARIPKKLRDEFWDTVPRGTVRQHVMAAAARLWVGLPEEYRKRLIDAEALGNGESTPASFMQIIEEVTKELFKSPEFYKAVKDAKGH